jgi:hypothetical protein
MVPKIAWVVLPLAVYGLYLGVAALRGRLPARQAVNMQTSLLLVTYLLSTAGLGIFWVANQQARVRLALSVRLLHRVLLVSVHLFFSLPLVLRWLRGPQRARPRLAAIVQRPGRCWRWACGAPLSCS